MSAAGTPCARSAAPRCARTRVNCAPLSDEVIGSGPSRCPAAGSSICRMTRRTWAAVHSGPVPPGGSGNPGSDRSGAWTSAISSAIPRSPPSSAHRFAGAAHSTTLVTSRAHPAPFGGVATAGLRHSPRSAGDLGGLRLHRWGRRGLCPVPGPHAPGRLPRKPCSRPDPPLETAITTSMPSRVQWAGAATARRSPVIHEHAGTTLTEAGDLEHGGHVSSPSGRSCWWVASAGTAARRRAAGC